jgi:L-fuculose-phosphate aldolase
MLAQQMGAPITNIGAEKAGDLLAIKQRLGLPDSRIGMKECQLCDMPEPGSISVAPQSCGLSARPAGNVEIESIVQAVTDAVMASLEAKRKA